MSILVLIVYHIIILHTHICRSCFKGHAPTNITTGLRKHVLTFFLNDQCRPSEVKKWSLKYLSIPPPPFLPFLCLHRACAVARKVIGF